MGEHSAQVRSHLCRVMGGVRLWTAESRQTLQGHRGNGRWGHLVRPHGGLHVVSTVKKHVSRTRGTYCRHDRLLANLTPSQSSWSLWCKRMRMEFHGIYLKVEPRQMQDFVTTERPRHFILCEMKSV